MPISPPQRGHGRHDAGFTLVELMVAVVLVAILAAMAGPSFTRQIEAGRQRSATNELQQAVRLASSHATAASRPVTLCSSSNSYLCDGDWTINGWILFLDKDRNGYRNDDEALLLTSENRQQRLYKVSSPAIDFNANGINNATTIRICSEADSSLDLDLNISAFGLVEVSKGVIGGCS